MGVKIVGVGSTGAKVCLNVVKLIYNTTGNFNGLDEIVILETNEAVRKDVKSRIKEIVDLSNAQVQISALSLESEINELYKQVTQKYVGGLTSTVAGAGNRREIGYLVYKTSNESKDETFRQKVNAWQQSLDRVIVIGSGAGGTASGMFPQIIYDLLQKQLTTVSILLVPSESYVSSIRKANSIVAIRDTLWAIEKSKHPDVGRLFTLSTKNIAGNWVINGNATDEESNYRALMEVSAVFILALLEHFSQQNNGIAQLGNNGKILYSISFNQVVLNGIRRSRIRERIKKVREAIRRQLEQKYGEGLIEKFHKNIIEDILKNRNLYESEQCSKKELQEKAKEELSRRLFAPNLATKSWLSYIKDHLYKKHYESACCKYIDEISIYEDNDEVYYSLAVSVDRHHKIINKIRFHIIICRLLNKIMNRLESIKLETKSALSRIERDFGFEFIDNDSVNFIGFSEPDVNAEEVDDVLKKLIGEVVFTDDWNKRMESLKKGIMKIITARTNNQNSAQINNQHNLQNSNILLELTNNQNLYINVNTINFNNQNSFFISGGISIYSIAGISDLKLWKDGFTKSELQSPSTYNLLRYPSYSFAQNGRGKEKLWEWFTNKNNNIVQCKKGLCTINPACCSLLLLSYVVVKQVNGKNYEMVPLKGLSNVYLPISYPQNAGPIISADNTPDALIWRWGIENGLWTV